MTVLELINELLHLPPDYSVVIYDSDWGEEEICDAGKNDRAKKVVIST